MGLVDVIAMAAIILAAVWLLCRSLRKGGCGCGECGNPACRSRQAKK